MIKRLAIALFTLAATAAPAFAHLGPTEHGSFMAGLSHPLFGADHILAMVAVGLWAALLGGRAIAFRITPTPNPSPQGGGGFPGAAPRQTAAILAEKAATSFPSPLWGGVRGGGTRLGEPSKISARRGQSSALWLVPSAFVGTMMAGFAAALAGLALPFVEPVILASVIVIGLAAAVALRVPAGVASAMVGFFAFFHGHAHGGELGSAGALSFGLGFALSTALLHLAGLATGLGPGRAFGGQAGPLVTRVAGGAAALGGLWLAIA